MNLTKSKYLIVCEFISTTPLLINFNDLENALEFAVGHSDSERRSTVFQLDNLSGFYTEIRTFGGEAR